jgi:FkbM family methyltransferase
MTAHYAWELACFLNECNENLNGEMALWRHLRGQPGALRCVVDVGCREDDYYFRSGGASGSGQIDFHLFEPHPLFFERIAAKAVGRTDVRVNNVALGAERAVLPYYDGSQSFVCRPICGDVEGRPSRRLPVTTLRDYLVENELDKDDIDFLKIDTEGFEIDVLRGLGDLFPRVKHLQFEYGGTYPDRGVLLRDVYDLVETAGKGLYSIYIVGPDGVHARPNPIEHGQYSNYVASRAPHELPVVGTE